MRPSTTFAGLAASAPALVLLGLPSPSEAAAALGPKACAAQNILANCLSIQGIQFTACSYSDWACKCQAQKALVQCYNNCPGDDARAAQEGQVTVYCNAAMREEEQKSSSLAKASSSSSATGNKAKGSQSADDNAASTMDVDEDEGLVRSRKADAGSDRGRASRGGSSKHRAGSGSPVSLADSAGAAAATGALCSLSSAAMASAALLMLL
ncbi:hypothetical protein LPJ56_004824 [Coemansia sp. RSA 2599]|nr:hypothetical protein LPJ75_004698 [Coemansia sp. RSA 2598]KAJ1814541.1 hypothetical protein LPJ56_004824 [Coemansia sp. RSA 2599]